MMRVICCGRSSIWWRWRVVPVAPRLVNSVPCVKMINHESDFHGRRSIWWCWRVTSGAPCDVNEISYVHNVKRIDHEIYFSWQAQYLVKFKRHFSWQWQYLVKFGMMPEREMMNFSIENSDAFMLGSWSDLARIVNHISAVFGKLLWDYLEGHFSWQGQYVVTLEDGTCCAAQCKWRFICDEDQCHSGWHLLLRAL